MLPYAHPAAGAVVLLAAAYVARLAVRGRTRRTRELRLHARLGRFLWIIVLLNWASGLLSAWLLRPELHLARSGHFWAGTVIAILFTASACSSRWIGSPLARAVHPWFGAAALATSGFQALSGLELLP